MKEYGFLDEVTGLPNRAIMQSHLRETLGTFKELHIPFGSVGCSEESLQDVRARMLRMLCSATINWWGEELSIAVSIGCTGAQPGDSVESILQRAQQTIGGNRIALPQTAAPAGKALSTKSLAT